METENLPVYHSASLWPTQDQRALLQITDDIYGCMGSILTPSLQTLLFPPSYILNPEIVWVNIKPLDSISCDT